MKLCGTDKIFRRYKMKKLLATALAFTLTFAAFSIPAVENDSCIADKLAVSASAETYEDYEYETMDDGNVMITDYNGDSETITIPSAIDGKEVTSIGKHAFENCSSLKSITIPNCITTIDDDAFNGCTSLINITIPDSVTNIGNSVFSYCYDLHNITVDPGNKYYASIDGVLFNKEKTTLIHCPSGNERTTYSIPNSVENIGSMAFNCCWELTSITIPNSVISIDYYAFENCSGLTSLTIPDSVANIDNTAFSYCYNLNDINVDPDNKNYTSIDGVVFNKEKTELIRCPSGNERTTYTIPDSVTSIGDEAFNNCKRLTSVTISDNVKSIGSYAFESCSSLANVTIPNSVTNIEYCAFFDCSSLTSVTIPNSITSIKNGVFAHCSSLTSITIPNSVKSIEYRVFYNCESLTDVFYNGTESDWANIEISGYDNESLANATIHYAYKDISSCTMSLPTATQYFRGTRIKPVLTVKDGETTLKAGTDYIATYKNNLSVGTATITITGKGNYKETVTKTFDIVQRSINNCTVELDAQSYDFTGTRIKPSVKVYSNGVEMYSGNYTVAYSNNLSAGTATITLTGKKNLKGTVTKTFKINPKDISDCTVELTKNSANEYKPTVAVKIGSTSVYSGNYTVNYTTSADKKTVTVTLTGKGNLTGTVTKTYTVE